jgi:glycerol kinase
MQSVIAVDTQGRPLTRSITWTDNRAAVWSERIVREWGDNAIYRRTGTPIHPMSPLAKLVWLRHERADLFGRAARFIGIKEYLLFRLFGRYVVDSIASATGLFNIERLDWDDLGRVASLDVISGMVGATDRHSPISQNAAIYRRLLPIYLSIPKNSNRSMVPSRPCKRNSRLHRRSSGGVLSVGRIILGRGLPRRAMAGTGRYNLLIVFAR